MAADRIPRQQATDLIWVCRRLAARLQSGSTIVRALATAAQGAPTGPRALLRGMRKRVASGGKMSDEMRAAGAPAYIWGAVRSGEVSSEVERALLRLADHLEWEQAAGTPRNRSVQGYALALGRLGMMLAVGVPVVQAVEAAAESVSESEAGGRLEAARQAILQGSMLSEAVEGVAELPPMTVEMIRDGERDGRLAEALPIVADYLLEEAGRKSREVRNA